MGYDGLLLMYNSSCCYIMFLSVQGLISMKLVRLKPQGPSPDRGPDRPVQRKFTKPSSRWAQKFLERKFAVF